MIKKLDLLIVKAFVGPFIATFFITLFVLVLQFFWLYIDDVVGKGIDAFTVILGRIQGIPQSPAHFGRRPQSDFGRMMD